QARGQRVSGEMVDAEKRKPGRGRHSLGAHNAGEHTADQARSGGHGNAVDVSERDSCIRQGLLGAKVDLLDMGAGRDFRHDAAERRVKVSLPGDHRRQDRALAARQADDRRSGVVAARFEPEEGDRLFAHGTAGCPVPAGQVTPGRPSHNPEGAVKPVRPILFLTRPEMQSRRFAEEFRARFGADWPVVIAPLTEIVRLGPALPADLPAHVVFTSENAVAAFAALSPDRTALAWCVGPRTEAAARAAGFATRLGPGDGAGLARSIASDPSVRQVLYPRPVHAAGDIPGALESAGIETVPVVVYDQREQPFSGAASAVLAGSVPVLLPLF